MDNTDSFISNDVYLEKNHSNSAVLMDIEQQFSQQEGKVYTGPKFGKRHLEAIYIFLGLFISFLMRVQMSVTIVAMTTPNNNDNVPTFAWTNRNVILSAFLWGYVIPQIHAGWLMTKYGPKWFIIGSVAIGSIIGYLIPPLAVRGGSNAVIVCRVVQGLSQGFIIPSIPIFISAWVPPSERGRTGTFIFAGGAIGTVFAMMIAGAISASTFGWPMVFHFSSTLGIIWCIVYAFCGHNSPDKCKSITFDEKAYIEKTNPVRKGSLQVPWKNILLSGPCLALFYSCTCFIFGFWVLLTQIPTYMNKIMSFDLSTNGLLSALPYLAQWIFGLVTSIVCDWITNKNIFSVSAIRKYINSLGMVAPAIALFFLAMCSKDNSTMAVILLVVSVGSTGANFCGSFINNIDLSPNFAGVIHGIVNGGSSVFGIIAPLLVQIMVPDEKNVIYWQRVFYLTGIVYISGAIVFGIFGSGKIQPWNNIKKQEKDNDLK